MKSPFRGLNKIFTKTIPSGFNNVFSKRNMNDLRNKVSDTLQSQGKILTTVGKIGTGLALPLGLASAAFAPPLLPFIMGAGALSGVIGGTGMIERASGNLLKPSLYRGKNGLQTTGAVVNQTKGVG